MNKNRIRLTESQLHRVIKESVKRILNEVEFGGESLHGNSPEDWTAIGKVRHHINTNDNLLNTIFLVFQRKHASSMYG